MKTYRPYSPHAPVQITGERHMIQDSFIVLNDIPYENSIDIAGFKQTSSTNLQQNQFFCNYGADYLYRESNCIVYFHGSQNGKIVSVDYLSVGTIVTANDLNEIKAHLENSLIHGSHEVPIATRETRGGIRVGDGLYMSGDVLNCSVQGGSGGVELVPATAEVLGGVKVGQRLSVTEDGVLSADSIPAATRSSLGTVIVGNHLSVNNGTLDYNLPTASENVLGGVKIGEGLTITDGVLSADATNYTLPIATQETLGGVFAGQTMSIEDGVIDYYLPTASTTQLGGVKVGSSLTIADGVLNYSLPTASDTLKGGIKIGHGLQMNGEVANVVLGTTPSTIEGAMWLSS